MLSLFCPSRGRPQAAAALLASFNATKTRSDVHLTFCVDYDDPTRESYPIGNTALDVGSGDPVTPLNRWALKSESGIVGFIGDDSRFETVGWDEKVIHALKRPGFCWAWDGHDRPWPSTYFVSREIVQALGYLALPTMKRGYFDTVVIGLAEQTHTDRVLTNVMIRHDNTVHEQPDPKVIHEDYLAHKDWFENCFDEDVKKVRSVELARFFA